MSFVQTTQLNPPVDMIDLGIGQPGPSLLPLAAIRQAASARLAEADPSLLQYGVEQGDGYFRLALADFLSNQYDQPVTSEQLFVTTGISQGLDLICTFFAQPGDVVFVEEPSYFLALRIFADRGLRVVSLPLDQAGLQLEALEAALEKESPAFLYTVPTFHNPAGVTLSAERREQLVALSQAHNFFIVADEVYHLLAYTESPPPPLASFSQSQTVLSLGSFSKILAPGLRLGWIQAAPPLFERLIKSGLLDSGGGLNPFTSGIVRSALELGLQTDYLAELKTVYQRRAARLSQALRDHLPPEAHFSQPGGGFFIWLRLPKEVDAETLLPTAHAHRVGYRAGIKFSSRGNLRNYIRLCFAYYKADQLETGAARLAAALTAHRAG